MEEAAFLGEPGGRMGNRGAGRDSVVKQVDEFLLFDHRAGAAEGGPDVLLDAGDRDGGPFAAECGVGGEDGHGLPVGAAAIAGAGGQFVGLDFADDRADGDAGVAFDEVADEVEEGHDAVEVAIRRRAPGAAAQ